MITDRFPVSKSLPVLETTDLILNLEILSTKYLLKVFANSISIVSTFLFSVKVILFLVVT